MGILQTLAAASQNQTSNTAADGGTQKERKSSDVWVNIGINLPGAAEDGSDLFVSLPVGLPLDDMKPVVIRGTNQNSIQLKQVKNMLLDELQKLGTSLTPGQRVPVPQLSVEVYRVAKPDQVASKDTNPLVNALFGALGAK